MVRYHKSYYVQEFPEAERVRYVEGACESTDEKPTYRIAQGSILMETDTGKIYVFSEETSGWSEFKA